MLGVVKYMVATGKNMDAGCIIVLFQFLKKNFYFGVSKMYVKFVDLQ